MNIHDETENHMVVDDANEYEDGPLFWIPIRMKLAFELHHGIPEPIVEEDEGCIFFKNQWV